MVLSTCYVPSTELRNVTYPFHITFTVALRITSDLQNEIILKTFIQNHCYMPEHFPRRRVSPRINL